LVQEFEPLQDTLPNRYAIESDDSEDDVTLNAYPSAPDQLKRPKEVYIADFVWNEAARSPSGRKTYVAISQAGLTWAAGTALGDPEAQVRVNEEIVSLRLYHGGVRVETHLGREGVLSASRLGG